MAIFYHTKLFSENFVFSLPSPLPLRDRGKKDPIRTKVKVKNVKKYKGSTVLYCNTVPVCFGNILTLLAFTTGHIFRSFSLIQPEKL